MKKTLILFLIFVCGCTFAGQPVPPATRSVDAVQLQQAQAMVNGANMDIFSPLVRDTETRETPTVKNVYIRLGQSNQAGSHFSPDDPVNDIDSRYFNENTEMYYFGHTTSDGAADGSPVNTMSYLDIYNTNIWSGEISFGDAMRDNGIVNKVAQGATSLGSSWLPPSGFMYQRWKASWDALDAWASSNSVTLNPVSVSWDQGQSDMGTALYGTNYYSNLQALMDAVEAYVGKTNLIWTLNTAPTTASGSAYYNDVRNAKFQHASDKDNVFIIVRDGDGLRNNSHFDCASDISRGYEEAAIVAQERNAREVASRPVTTGIDGTKYIGANTLDLVSGAVTSWRTGYYPPSDNLAQFFKESGYTNKLTAYTGSDADLYGVNCAYFDGITKLALNETAVIPLGTNDIYMSFWWNPDASPASRGYIFGQWASGAAGNGALVLSQETSNIIQLYWKLDGFVISSSALTPGDWYFVELTRTNTVFELFVDGTSQGTHSSTQAITAAAGTAYIGDNSTSPCRGHLSNFRINDNYYPLSEGNGSLSYNAGNPALITTPIHATYNTATNVWKTTAGAPSWNLSKGYAAWTNGADTVYVPFTVAGVAATNAVSGYTLNRSKSGGFPHNGSEASIILGDFTTNSYADLIAFTDTTQEKVTVTTNGYVHSLMRYSPPVTGESLTTLNDFVEATN
jgi:hypothetical protein